MRPIQLLLTFLALLALGGVSLWLLGDGRDDTELADPAGGGQAEATATEDASTTKEPRTDASARGANDAPPGETAASKSGSESGAAKGPAAGAPSGTPPGAGPEAEEEDPEAARRERLATLARLRAEHDAAADTPWALIDGCPVPTTIPAAMTGLANRVFVATEDRLAAYDLDLGTWEPELVHLPEPVGSGVALTGDGVDTLYLTPGGDRRHVWRVSLGARTLEALPEPEPLIGRGAAIACRDGFVYLAPGRRTETLLALPPGGDAWHDLGRIGGPSKVVTSFGRNAGFLAELDGSLYAAPDHHLQRFHIGLQTWGKGVWLALGFRPSLNGGGFAADAEVGSVFAACGMYSRSLNEIVADPPPNLGGEFHYLRPRLPYPMIGEGDRLTIARKGGVPHLIAYAVEPEDRLCLLPCADLVRLDREDDAADVGSAWRRLHVGGGGSGIRRRAELGPDRVVTHAPGTMGVLGALGEGQLFFMRLANVRRIEPETGTCTFYPGRNVGAYLAPGCDGVFDGERFLYMTAGGSDLFVRWEVPDGPPEQRRFSGTRRPVTETDLELLPPLPAEAWDGSALAYLDGAVYALRGAGTRDLWRFVVAERRWETLAPLPPEARVPGELGTGLVAAAGGVYAIPDRVVWRYDVATGAWERFAELPFGPSWDGGMVRNDGARHLYVFRGGLSTRFGRLDLATAEFNDLGPAPPDTLGSEGNRLAILTVAGERRLYVHRGHNSNEIIWIPVADLAPKPAPR